MPRPLRRPWPWPPERSGPGLWLPFGLAPFYWVAFLLFLIPFRRARDGRDAVKLGLAMGFARYAVSAHFLLALLRYSPLAIVFYLLAIAYILPFAVLEAWGSFWLERRTGLPRAVGFGLIWVILEKVRTLSDLSFPADLLAHGMGASPDWLAITAWTGPFVVPLWMCLVAAGMLAAWTSWQGGRRSRAALLAACSLAGWGLPRLAAPLLAGEHENPLPALRLSIVQPFATVDEKKDPRQWPRLRRRIWRMTRKAAEDADLILWPESARPGPVIWRTSSPFADEDLSQLSREVGVPILYGADLFAWDRTDGHRRLGKLYNGAALATPRGTARRWYGKQRLLPFAEGVPFADLIGWDPSRRKGGDGYLTLLGNFTPGPRPTLFQVGAARIGVLICYEGMYPQLARRYRNEGANLLVVMTNDAWWGRSVFPAWHATMAGSRARELDVPVVRAANSGVSSLADRLGHVQARTGVAESTILRGTIRPSSTPPTFYARHGDWLVGLDLLFVALALAFGIFRRRAV
ncbi:MAG: apolipoprotein N-acyltransferase [Acidobacteriota bacterium]|nr:apolipoprotein N-acyltransferase [Acidobacteriota bacterium]